MKEEQWQLGRKCLRPLKEGAHHSLALSVTCGRKTGATKCTADQPNGSPTSPWSAATQQTFRSSRWLAKKKTLLWRGQSSSSNSSKWFKRQFQVQLVLPCHHTRAPWETARNGKSAFNNLLHIRLSSNQTAPIKLKTEPLRRLDKHRLNILWFVQ